MRASHHNNWRFKSPFKVNGCGPCAIAHLADKPSARLAKRVWATGRAITLREGIKLTDRKFSVYMVSNRERASRWLKIIGKRVAEELKPAEVKTVAVNDRTGESFEVTFDKSRGARWATEHAQWQKAQIEAAKRGWNVLETSYNVKEARPTVAQFLRGRGREGRWLVGTTGHVIAVIDGEAFGYYRTRCRVRQAYRVEDTE